jgi:hypothetical protein
MNPRLVFLEALLPLLAQMSRSPNPSLAAEAAEEVAVKSKELAKLKRASAESSQEAQAVTPAMAA